MTNGTYPPSGPPQARFDHLAALTNCRISNGRLRIPCPAHGGTDPNLALWVGGDAIAAKCHSADCSYADIAMAILARYGISIGRGLRQDHTPTVIVCARDSTGKLLSQRVDGGRAEPPSSDADPGVILGRTQRRPSYETC